MLIPMSMPVIPVLLIARPGTLIAVAGVRTVHAAVSVTRLALARAVALFAIIFAGWLFIHVFPSCLTFMLSISINKLIHLLNIRIVFAI